MALACSIEHLNLLPAHIYIPKYFTLCTKFNLAPERISDIHGILKRFPTRKAIDLVALNLMSNSRANSMQIYSIFCIPLKV